MIQIKHLETLVHTVCTLRCTGCNNFVNAHHHQGQKIVSTPEGVEKDLTHLATIMHAEKWGALGGDPTLHPKIIPILQAVRRSGICDQSEVWTNGLTWKHLKPEFWRSFDILVVSVYPGKHTKESLRDLTQKCQDEGVKLDLKDEVFTVQNWRTCLEPTPDTDPAYTKAKYSDCFFRGFSRNATMGYFFTCCTSPSIPMLFQGKPFGTDGVKIEGLTEAQLQAYLTRSEPLGACTVCAGRETAKAHPWGEERDPVTWVQRSKGL